MSLRERRAAGAGTMYRADGSIVDLTLLYENLRDGVQSLRTVRVGALLPAAGAYDAAPTELLCSTENALTLYVGYARGGVGGSMRLRVQVSPYTVDVPAVENWFQLGLYEASAVVAGSDVTSEIQRETLLYTATSANVETFIYGPIMLKGTAGRVRVAAAEVGAVGTPGTCSILGVFQQRN